MTATTLSRLAYWATMHGLTTPHVVCGTTTTGKHVYLSTAPGVTRWKQLVDLDPEHDKCVFGSQPGAKYFLDLAKGIYGEVDDIVTAEVVSLAGCQHAETLLQEEVYAS